MVCSVTQQVLAAPNNKGMVNKNFVNRCNFFGTSASVPRFGYVFDYQFQLQRISEWTQFIHIYYRSIASLFEPIVIFLYHHRFDY